MKNPKTTCRLICSFCPNGHRKTQARINMRVIPGTIVEGRSKESGRNGTINVGEMIVKVGESADLEARMGVVIKEITEGGNQVFERLKAGAENAMTAVEKEVAFKDRRLLSSVCGWSLSLMNKEWNLLQRK